MATTALAVGLIGATASAAPAPIKIGQLVTEGAAVGFPTTGSRTLQGFFKDYNAHGGFKGRKIQVEVANDNFNGATSVATTKQLIDDGIVAFVGSVGVLNCLGNAGLQQQANIYTVGFGNQNACFAMKQFGSVSTSLPTQMALSALYAKKHTGGKICLIGFSIPGTASLYERAEQILAKLGTKFAFKDVGVSPTADPTAALLQAKSAGCRSTLTFLSGAQSIQALKGKATQKIKNMDLVLVNGHDYKTIKGAGNSAAEGSYVFTFMYPFSDNDSRIKAYRRLTNKYNITPDPFSLVSYISAQLFVKALESVKGTVTRQSVGAAIAKLNAKNPLLPSGSFKFGGDGTGNAPNIGGYMLQIKNGKFVKAPGSLVLLPPAARSLGGR